MNDSVTTVFVEHPLPSLGSAKEIFSSIKNNFDDVAVLQKLHLKINSLVSKYICARRHGAMLPIRA